MEEDSATAEQREEVITPTVQSDDEPQEEAQHQTARDEFSGGRVMSLNRALGGESSDEEEDDEPILLEKGEFSSLI